MSNPDTTAADALWTAIREALGHHRCWSHIDEDGDPLPLVDRLTHGPDIGPGSAELDSLADAIAEAAGVAWERRASPAAQEAFNRAMKQSYCMVDAIAPPPEGSYYRGEHNGIIAALKTVRDNFEREVRALGVIPEPPTQEPKL